MSTDQIEELPPLTLGKGTLMRMFIDHSKSEASPGYNWSDVTWDGTSLPVLEVPKHWHRDHDEIMEILEGSITINLDGKDHVVSAGDPPLLIERGHIHGIKGIEGVAVRVIERTIPSGTFKAHFFQDLLQTGQLPGFLLIMRVFYDGDCYASLPGGFKWLDSAFLTVVGLIAKPFVPGKAKDLKRMGAHSA